MQGSVVLLLVFVVVGAHYYDKDKTPSCKFPCPWRGKTFDFWEIGKSKSEFYAKFSKDGRRITWSFGRTEECYQILDGFLVIRTKGEDKWACFKIQYDKTKRPTTFRLHNGSPKQSRKFGCNIPKGCECCKHPNCGRCRKCKDNGSITNAC
ncbi:Hypothetical predicted protein [Mytilus galloprovincialis]|uniref:Uncharacterized protein n=1 Tax=Mytilus galloprovincialis TaxID=29158 RepID=A0A8B6D2P2_MYTGA|nr:Hypothetical predicted protein [Mytilus galloprovincialis]